MAVTHRSVVVIIGAYSTGRFLLLLFKANGYDCVHIHAYPDIQVEYMTGFEEVKDLLLEDIVFDGNENNLLDTLKKYQIEYIIPGSESGVHLADILNEALNLPYGNDMHLSKARRDKYLMQITLKNANVSYIPSFISSSLTESIKKAHEINFPIVIKPLSSSDAEGVFFCSSNEDLEKAFTSLIGCKNLYGELSNNILIQKRMIGDEYVVNTVSYDGLHIVTDIWSNNKLNILGNPIYDYQNFVSPQDKIFNILADYTREVLDALGIKYGAAHAEIILTDDGPFLIEVGARLAGAVDPSAMMKAKGYCQLSMLIDSYLNPTKFTSYLAAMPIKGTSKYLKIISLISNTEGIIKNVDLSFIENLQEFHCIQHGMYPKAILKKTINLSTSPGNIYLLADFAEDLNKCYYVIREFEQKWYVNMLA